jgi:hypothetical protein
VNNAQKMYNIKFIRRDFKTLVTNTIWLTLQDMDFFLYTLPLQQNCTSRYNREVCVHMVLLCSTVNACGITVLTNVDNSVRVRFKSELYGRGCGVGNIPPGVILATYACLILLLRVHTMPDKTASCAYYRRQTVRLRTFE